LLTRALGCWLLRIIFIAQLVRDAAGCGLAKPAMIALSVRHLRESGMGSGERFWPMAGWP